YPNPSTDALTLPASLGAVQYRIFNPLGQTLLQGQAAGIERLDVRTLPKGPFFLELSDATGRHTQRLVKE
ncbi:T9SS type A sorting domain-containing protein, partial [Hymenobacter agri]